MSATATAPTVQAEARVDTTTRTDGAAIVTRGLTKRFGTITALDHLDLEVPIGSVFGLLGPNGAGKTTTLRLLTGLARATEGTARVAGVPIDHVDGSLQRSIGYLDQDPRFYGWMRGDDLLDLVARLYELDDATRRTRIAEVLEIVGMTGAAHRRIGTYSGGMHQRIGLAAALLHRPAVLFLDEPVSSLDPVGRAGILEVIERLRGVATVVMSTHILNDVERVCDRVGILDHGRLIAEGPIDDLLERFARPVYQVEPDRGQGPEVEALVGRLRSEAWVRAVTIEHGILRVVVRDPKSAAHGLVAALATSGVSVASFERQRPSLEEVFLQLVGQANGLAAPVEPSAIPPSAGTPAPGSNEREATR